MYILLALSLAMDAFAVSISLGTDRQTRLRTTALFAGVLFGLFQGGMTAAGYLLSTVFYDWVCHVDHWIAALLLSIIGIKMIVESFTADTEENSRPSPGIRSMLFLALATSIDAFAAGAGLSFLCVSIVRPALTIGAVTLILSFFGVIWGGKLGMKFGHRAELTGGIVLLLLAVKILVDGLLIG